MRISYLPYLVVHSTNYNTYSDIRSTLLFFSSLECFHFYNIHSILLNIIFQILIYPQWQPTSASNPIETPQTPQTLQKKKVTACFDPLQLNLADALFGLTSIIMADSSQPSVDPDRPSNAILNNHRSSVPSGNDRGDDREALELHEIQTREDDELNYSSPSASSGEEVRVTTRRTRSRASVTSAHQGKHPWSRVCHFWTHNVTLTVPQKSNRDHFGKLMKERPV